MGQENIWILGYPEEFYEKAFPEPKFFADLNLDQVTAQIMAERKEYDLRKYFNRMPEDISITKKRQEVLRALEDSELFEKLVIFSNYMQCARAYAANYQTTERELCRQKLLLDCGVQYAHALDALFSAFSIRQREKEGAGGLLEAFAKKFRKYMEGEEYRAFYQDTKSLWDEFETMAFRVEFANRRMRVVPAEKRETGDYFDKLRALFPENTEGGRIVRGQLENPFRAKREVGELEFFVLTVCQKKYPESFLKLRRYEQNYFVMQKRELTVQMREKGMSEQVRAPRFLAEWVLTFERQLQVYLAMELFLRRVRKTGYPLTYAVFPREGAENGGEKYSKEKDMHSNVENEINAEGQRKTITAKNNTYENMMELKKAYDLALLLKQISKEKPVVCNDAYYTKKEHFLVVTGPNQGGKTTFARSLGQIVYFAKMGFPAPCALACMPYFSELLTHFSVEESLETGRGKLKEELTRLAPMMCEGYRKSFVILNELFTTAATYDAYIMGRRVMAHFIKQDCFGVYVTHIQELAEEKGTGEEWGKEKRQRTEEGMEGRVVSMAACVDEQDSHIRTYKIVRRAPEGVGYAYALVEKYHLTYPELKERLVSSLRNLK